MGVVSGKIVSGRIDRLIVEPGRVVIVDFKTNRPAPPARPKFRKYTAGSLPPTVPCLNEFIRTKKLSL